MLNITVCIFEYALTCIAVVQFLSFILYMGNPSHNVYSLLIQITCNELTLHFKEVTLHISHHLLSQMQAAVSDGEHASTQESDVGR